MAQPRTLDVKDPQVLVNFPGDPGGFFWHHRLLLHRVSDGRWVCLTPDFHLVIHDLANLPHRVVGRAREFPGDISHQCYVFDPIDEGTLKGYRKDAKLQAAILGPEAPEEQRGMVWIVAEPAGAHLGETVPEESIEDNEHAAIL